MASYRYNIEIRMGTNKENKNNNGSAFITDDVVCLESSSYYVDHYIRFRRTRPSAYAMMKGTEVFRKNKLASLLYGPWPKVARMVREPRRGGRVKKRRVVVGIANPLKHYGGMAFAILKYYPLVYYSAPINDYGLLTVEAELVGWGYIPSKKEVNNAAGACLRLRAESEGLTYVGIRSLLVNTSTLIPSPTTHAHETEAVIDGGRRRMKARVWRTANLPYAEVIKRKI